MKQNSSPILFVAVLINTLIFISLSLLHFYWTFGGKLWYDEVLPTNSMGTRRMNPGTTVSLIVSFGLLLFALVTAGNKGVFTKYIKPKYYRYGSLVIAVIFVLRAIGDFKFAGFFKTIKHTRFATNDTLIFSPLCVFISLLALLIFVLNKNKT